MKILVLFNPISGAGRAAAGGTQAAAWLAALGHKVSIAHTRLEPPALWLDEQLSQHQLLLVAGGDGTVRMASESACRTRTPIYHLPFGTANLFAGECSMDGTQESIMRTITRFQVRDVDVGIANGQPFLLMASVGYDAEVVHELAARRGASISHFSYLRPMWAQFRHWQPPHLQVSVDGHRIDDGGPGFVVVANSRHYGGRFNPCGRASISDGQLDIAYFPARWRRQMIAWAVRCRMQSHLRHPKLAYSMGRKVMIVSQTPQRYQLDGDPAGVFAQNGGSSNLESTGAGGWQLNIEIRPGVLPVLVS